jgi:hypothetical protein
LDVQRRQQLIDRVACRIANMGLITPALLFLEMNKPLAFIGAQTLLVAQPFLDIGLNRADVSDLASILEDRAGVEELIDRLEFYRNAPPRP